MKGFLLLLLSAFLAILTACAVPYRDEDFLGKTSAEIITQYGDFDCVTMPAEEDGLFRNCLCGYLIKESRPGFFGRSDEQLFFIRFDDNGIASACETGVRPGG